MGKYQPLTDRLAASPADEWSTSFAELERLLGFPLPKAARSGRKWWANDLDKGHSRAWAAHGWGVGEVDPASGRVVFRRTAAAEPAAEEAAGSETAAAAGSHSSREIQPVAMRQAAEAASRQAHAGGAWRVTALVAAGVTMIAGLGALVVRALGPRR